MTDSLTIRSARPSDAAALFGLAALDSAKVPEGDLLVAETAGHLMAAVSLSGDAVIADPFLPTAHTVDLLRTYAEQLRAPRRGAQRPARRLRLRTASG